MREDCSLKHAQLLSTIYVRALVARPNARAVVSELGRRPRPHPGMGADRAIGRGDAHRRLRAHPARHRGRQRAHWLTERDTELRVQWAHGQRLQLGHVGQQHGSGNLVLRVHERLHDFVLHWRKLRGFHHVFRLLGSAEFGGPELGTMVGDDYWKFVPSGLHVRLSQPWAMHANLLVDIRVR